MCKETFVDNDESKGLSIR